MRRFGFITTMFFMIIVCALHARPVLGQESQLVISALKEADRGNITQAYSIISKVSKPAAKDTVDWFIYSQKGTNASFEQISRFVDSHADWPLLDKIRLEAEKNLNDNVPNNVLVSWFSKNQPLTANGIDRYIQALVSIGRTSDAKRTLQNWWPKASLTREQQRHFYSSYSQYFDKESHIERLNNLLYEDQYSNAEALAAVLAGGYPALAKARKALAQGSENANSLINLVPVALQNDEGLLYERLKWRRENNYDQGAIEILNKAPSASKMHTPKHWWKERHIIVRRLIEQKKYKEAYQLASSHKQKEGFPLAQAEWVSGWLALRFVNETWKAFEHFERLYKNVESPISKARGAYWAGRASEDLKHPEVAQQWFNVGMGYPETFYGQLSAEKLNISQPIKRDSVVNVTSVERNNFNNTALVQATKWLDAAGFRGEASVFLLRLTKNAKTVADYILAAELAEKLGQRHNAIKIAQALQQEKAISQNKYLYPNMVRELQNIRNTEWALINAIIRQESRFDYTAVSHAGARGLMQLMPATAKEVASRNGQSHQTAWLTTRPTHNITLGSKYLHQMVNRYDGNYAMAAAAYNAGPSRVDRWLQEFGDPRKGEIDYIDWIELIPIYETRNYVQRVLEGVYVYREQLKNVQNRSNGVIHVVAK